MAVLNRPSRTTDQQVVEIVLLCLLNEQLTSFALQRGDTTIFDGCSAGAVAAKEFFYVETGHDVLLII